MSQSVDLGEMPDIVRHERRIEGERVRRDHRVGKSYGPAPGEEGGLDASEGVRLFAAPVGYGVDAFAEAVYSLVKLR